MQYDAIYSVYQNKNPNIERIKEFQNSRRVKFLTKLPQQIFNIREVYKYFNWFHAVQDVINLKNIVEELISIVIPSWWVNAGQ